MKYMLMMHIPVGVLADDAGKPVISSSFAEGRGFLIGF
jgi:hypothetical protein